MKSFQEHLSHPKYRADIDGLRAVAVLAVVLFHAFPGWIKGGFVGVDIFFVISGYLISTIIFENLERGTFSFAEFYARRIKRIFPALLLVMFACLTFGWFALLEDEYKQLGKHVLAGAGFVSNFALWGESGYFDNASDAKPLLHLWSLGIEEQFYIFWPLLVWFAWRSKLGLLLITVSVLFGSFMWNVNPPIHADDAATFYSPLTRFWELSVGSLLAYMVLHKHIVPTRFSLSQANLISTAGVLCLLAALLVTHKSYAFPGWWALLPVVGTALIIAAGAKAWFNRVVLSSKIAVWFGLISFPLYLWHWPLLSFGKIIEGERPGALFKVLAIFASIVLAWLTFRFVESQIRFSKGWRFVNALIVGALLLAGGGAYVYSNDGIAERAAISKSGFTEEVRKQFVGALWPYTKNDICLNDYPFKESENYGWWFCMKSRADEPTLIILGSSYANQLYPGFVRNPLLAHHTVLSIGACDLAEKEHFEIDGKSPCYGNRVNDQAKFIDDLVMKGKSIRFAIIDGLSRNPDDAYIERLKNRVDFLESKGIQVIIFTPHLKPNFHPKACFTTLLRPVAKDCTFPERERATMFDKFKPLIDSISHSNPKLRFFEQNQIYCQQERCSMILNGLPLYRDVGHISEYASIDLHKFFTVWVKDNVPELFDAGFARR
jgi:peptidoglycan/LPS O-acetylase OafA/YrhL